MKKTRVGQIIARLLIKRSLRVTDLARLVNLPQPTVHRIVHGLCEHPHRSSLQPIADFFELSIDQLKGYEPIRELDAINKVPLLDWIEVQNWIEHDATIVPSKWVITDVTITLKGFALKVLDDAMDPVFPRSTTLIIDPDKPVKHLNFVIAQVNTAVRPIFRQFIAIKHNAYLKPLNPDTNYYNIIKINNTDKVLGKVIQVKRDWQD